jgi:hypothetical protein
LFLFFAVHISASCVYGNVYLLTLATALADVTNFITQGAPKSKKDGFPAVLRSGPPGAARKAETRAHSFPVAMSCGMCILPQTMTSFREGPA